MEALWIVFYAVWSAIMTFQITHFFCQRRESKLREQHSSEREEDRKARQVELEAEWKLRDEERERLYSKLSSREAPATSRSSRNVGREDFAGKVKGMSERLDELAQRVALLEAERDGDQQSTA